MEPFQPIPGKPPRQVVIDRQRKLFASLDIAELLLEFVSDLNFYCWDSNFRILAQICGSQRDLMIKLSSLNNFNLTPDYELQLNFIIVADFNGIY